LVFLAVTQIAELMFLRYFQIIRLGSKHGKFQPKGWLFVTVLSSIIKSNKKNLDLIKRNCYSREDLNAHNGKIISKSNF